MTQHTLKSFPVEISGLFFGGLEEILGLDEAESLVGEIDQNSNGFLREGAAQKTLSLAQINRILIELTARYGLPGSRGLILRVGRVFFKDFYRTHYHELGLLDLQYRMLPKPERIRVGLEKLAHEFARIYPGGAIVKETEDAYLWIFKSPAGNQRFDNCCAPLDYFFMGLFEEFLAWVTGGKYFHPVREVESSSVEPASCIIEVDKHFIT